MPNYWIGQREDSGGEERIRILRRASDDDVRGHPFSRRGLETEDVEGQMPSRFVEPQGDDTIGHPWRYMGPIDEEQGLFLVQVDSDEDVAGQGLRLG